MSDTPNTNGDFELQVLEEEYRYTCNAKQKPLSLFSPWTSVTTVFFTLANHQQKYTCQTSASVSVEDVVMPVEDTSPTQ